MNPPLSSDPDLACDACGKFGAYAFEEERLCLECYQERGSSCAGSRTPDATTDRPAPSEERDATR